jgi:hypothetical protein
MDPTRCTERGEGVDHNGEIGAIPGIDEPGGLTVMLDNSHACGRRRTQPPRHFWSNPVVAPIRVPNADD